MRPTAARATTSPPKDRPRIDSSSAVRLFASDPLADVKSKRRLSGAGSRTIERSGSAGSALLGGGPLKTSKMPFGSDLKAALPEKVPFDGSKMGTDDHG